MDASYKPVPAGLTVKEAAYLLGVSHKTVYSWCAKGRLKHYRLFGSIRIPISQVERMRKHRDRRY
jgi:excisionase family DNA binding protein